MYKKVEDRSQVNGLGRAWIAKQTKDTNGEVAYDIANILEVDNLKSFSVEEESSLEKDYASNKVFKKVQVKSGGSFNVAFANYPKELVEMFEGVELDENGTYVYKDSDITPTVGFIFELPLDDEDQNVVYLGAPSVVINRANEESETNEDGREFPTVELEGELFARIYDGVKKLKGSKYFSETFDKEVFFEEVFKNEVKDGEGTEGEGTEG